MNQHFTTFSQQHSGDTIHFSPANGLPLGSYNEFLNLLSQHINVSGHNNRGAWQQGLPKKGFTWHDHADDLITCLEQNYQHPVIAMGHSLGAQVSVIAAIKRPDLIKKLILIDAASTPTSLSGLLYKALPDWFCYRHIKFIARTLQRQSLWDSREQFINNYQNHPTYGRFTEQALSLYAQYGLHKNQQGKYELTYPAQWEAHNFRNVGYLWKYLPKVRCDTLLLRAEHSYMYTQAQFNHANKKLPHYIECDELKDSHHLVPLEQPEIVVRRVCRYLKLTT